MESPFNKLWPDICVFNNVIEQFRLFIKDLKEIKLKDKQTIDCKLKSCKLSIEKLSLSPVKRFDYLNEACNIVENLFCIVKKPKRLKDMDLILVAILKNYCAMLNEKIHFISQESHIYPKLGG